jgi:hypothetical protein
MCFFGTKKSAWLDGGGGAHPVEDPMIRDRHAVCVAREVLQHMPWSAEGWLGVDDPVVPKQLSQERAERGRLGQRVEVARE